jgi:hypothetical protein
LPKGKFYLTAYISDLKDIMEGDSNQKVVPVQLMDGIIWHNPGILFNQCECVTKRCDQKHSDFVQVLLPPNVYSKRYLQQNYIYLEENGAVIFGYNTNYNWLWHDSGDPKEEVFSEEDSLPLPDNPISLNNMCITHRTICHKDII